MKCIDAVIELLSRTDGPLTAEQITKQVLEVGLWTTTGITPEATVTSSIGVHIRKKGKKSKIIRVAKGEYMHSDNQKKSVDSEPKSESAPKLNCLDAAIEILRSADGPLNTEQITNQMLSSNLWTTTGKTPEATVSLCIAVHIRNKGSKSKIVRVASGKFMISDSLKIKTVGGNANSGSGNMSCLNAVIEILKSAESPLTAQEITQRILSLNLWTTTGKTPEATVSSNISMHIRNEGQKSKIVRVASGKFMIRDSYRINTVGDKANSGNGKMSCLNAAIAILKSAESPLTAKEITRRILDSNLWTTTGKTPEATVSSCITVHIRNKGQKSEIIRVASGEFKLRDSHSRNIEIEVSAKREIESSKGAPKIRLVQTRSLKKSKRLRLRNVINPSPLHRAVYTDDIILVRALVKSIPDVNILDSEGYTPLFWVKKSADIVRLLFESGANLDVRDKYGNTPLIWAADSGYSNVVKTLLELGSDPNCKNNYDETPLHYANSSEVVKLLIDAKAELEGRDLEGATPLYWVENKSLGKVKELVYAGANIDARDKAGATPMHWAAKNNEHLAIKEMKKLGALENTPDNLGATPMHWAAKSDSPQAVKSLKEIGANINANDSSGNTPLFWAEMNNCKKSASALLNNGAGIDTRDNQGLTPLHWASIRGHVEFVRELVKSEANLNIKDSDGLTPLHLAAIADQEKLFKVLLDAGANFNIKDNHQKTLLHIASGNGNRKIVKYLIDAGASTDSVDQNYFSPLHEAAKFGHVKIVEELIANGARITARDKNGNTPLHWSVEGDSSIIAVLQKAGADVSARNNQGDTPLHKAVEACNASAVKELIAANHEINAENSKEETPLQCALKNNYDEIGRLLKRAGGR